MDTVLSLILLVSEMLKIPRVKVGGHFLNKLASVNNKCLVQDAFGKFPRTTEKLSKYLAVNKYLCAQIFLLSRTFYKGIQVSVIYRLPRYIAPHK